MWKEKLKKGGLLIEGVNKTMVINKRNRYKRVRYDIKNDWRGHVSKEERDLSPLPKPIVNNIDEKGTKDDVNFDLEAEDDVLKKRESVGNGIVSLIEGADKQYTPNQFDGRDMIEDISNRKRIKKEKIEFNIESFKASESKEKKADDDFSDDDDLFVN